MGAFRLLTVPIRRIANSRLFQLAFVVAIILALDRYSFDYPILRPLAEGLKKLVSATVQLCSEYFHVGILTDPVLQVGLMIAYVYVVCLFAYFVLRIVTRAVIDFVGWSNFLWLRKTIARERGIVAYRAWLPLEKIRPAGYTQAVWEEEFAWPAGGGAPYPPLGTRMVHGALGYAAIFGCVAALLQFFTPFPVLSWLEKLVS